MEPQHPLLSEGKWRMLWRGTLKEHRPREETYSEYMIYVYSNICISIHLYVEKSDRKGKEDMPIVSYPNINISVYIVIRIANQVTVGDTALPPGQQRPGGTARQNRERQKKDRVKLPPHPVYKKIKNHALHIWNRTHRAITIV